ncbi:MAG: uroporphyrinogen decarboxylase family protein [Bacillota bacterium]|nr:uroporphyrinogen decarboxylase family protein [Bacillota bacterium]HPZ54848.1 uroporphyrinogen decarboxylase family protein [Bacillota bacterium]HQD17701.1 uroporphyrinogen decarboxylase family protein [Bacillota bacterium]
MTSKERVLAAISHQEPDRVPINYIANPGINARLMKHYGFGTDEVDAFLDALGVDFRSVGPRYVGPRLHPEVPGRNVDPLWGIRTRWVEHQSGGYWDYCDFPLRTATVEEVAEWPMPSPADFDYSGVEEACKRYSQYAVVAGNPGLADIINSTGMIRGTEQVLVDLILDEPAGLLYIDRRLDIMLEVTRRTLEAAKGGIDLLWIGEDLGMQNGPLISLELFRKHIRPRHQKFVDLAKSFDIPVMIHSCGSSSWAYDDFIDMGIQVIDTLQPEAKDMSPAYLKEHYGDKLAFHGCISTAGAVAYGTVEDVKKEVMEILDIMKPNGGYCLAPTHCLQDNSPVENVVCLYETAKEYGRY